MDIHVLAERGRSGVRYAASIGALPKWPPLLKVGVAGRDGWWEWTTSLICKLLPVRALFRGPYVVSLFASINKINHSPTCLQFPKAANKSLLNACWGGGGGGLLSTSLRVQILMVLLPDSAQLSIHQPTGLISCSDQNDMTIPSLNCIQHHHPRPESSVPTFLTLDASCPKVRPKVPPCCFCPKSL